MSKDLQTKSIDGISLCSRAGKDRCSSWESSQAERGNLTFPWLFVLCRSSPNWMMLTHTVYQFKCYSHLKTPSESHQKSCLFGHSVSQSTWHIKLSITNVYDEQSSISLYSYKSCSYWLLNRCKEFTKSLLYWKVFNLSLMLLLE